MCACMRVLHVCMLCCAQVYRAHVYGHTFEAICSYCVPFESGDNDILIHSGLVQVNAYTEGGGCRM